jgi:hypothetical protein
MQLPLAIASRIQKMLAYPSRFSSTVPLTLECGSSAGDLLRVVSSIVSTSRDSFLAKT